MSLNVPRKILLVCTANQCRSAAAETLLQARIDEVRLPIAVSSAGTNAWPGSSVLPETMEVMRGLGFDVSGHLSRPVTPALLDESDLVLAMARTHLAKLRSLQPSVMDRTFLFRPFCEGHLDQELRRLGGDVEDPVGRPLEAHDYCVRLIDTLCALLVESWQQIQIKHPDAWW